jgi:hypothetical protein
MTVFGAGNQLIGFSNFHLSCSDPDLNGVEDCGKSQGDGKNDDPSLINDWLFEGVVDSDETLDCTPLLPGEESEPACGLLGIEALPLLWLLRRRRSRKVAA